MKCGALGETLGVAFHGCLVAPLPRMLMKRREKS